MVMESEALKDGPKWSRWVGAECSTYRFLSFFRKPVTSGTVQENLSVSVITVQEALAL